MRNSLKSACLLIPGESVTHHLYYTKLENRLDQQRKLYKTQTSVILIWGWEQGP